MILMAIYAIWSLFDQYLTTPVFDSCPPIFTAPMYSSNWSTFSRWPKSWLSHWPSLITICSRFDHICIWLAAFHLLTLLDYYLITNWQLIDRYLVFTTNWSTFDCYLTSNWLIFDQYLTSFWSLFDHHLTTIWPLSDHCLTTAWPLFDHFSTTPFDHHVAMPRSKRLHLNGGSPKPFKPPFDYLF